MRIELVVKTEARARFVALLEERSTHPTVAFLRAQIFVEDVCEQLRTTGEPPDGSIVIRTSAEGYWWM